MANQPRSAANPADSVQLSVQHSGSAAAITAPGRFAPQGVPLIQGINRIGVWTLYMKEVRRFFKVQTQTIWAPAVTT